MHGYGPFLKERTNYRHLFVNTLSYEPSATQDQSTLQAQTCI